MLATTLTAITPFKVILFGENNKTFIRIIIVSLIELGHC
tara:strand:- start:3807 stop:3923 length:117 start_codon:yes stop_codon:yes gene_type:complete